MKATGCDQQMSWNANSYHSIMHAGALTGTNICCTVAHNKMLLQAQRMPTCLLTCSNGQAFPHGVALLHNA